MARVLFKSPSQTYHLYQQTAVNVSRRLFPSARYLSPGKYETSTSAMPPSMQSYSTETCLEFKRPNFEDVHYTGSRKRCTNSVNGIFLEQLEVIEDPIKVLRLFSACHEQCGEGNIAAVFLKINQFLNVISNSQMARAYTSLLLSQKEFIELCSLTEKRSPNLSDEIIVDILQSAAKILGQTSHPLLHRLRCEALLRVDRLDTSNLAKLARCLATLFHETASPSLGLIVKHFKVSDVKSFDDIVAMSTAASHITSKSLYNRLSEKALTLLKEDEKNAIHGNSLRQAMKTFRTAKALLKHCAHHLYPKLQQNLSTSNICYSLMLMRSEDFVKPMYEEEAVRTLISRLDDLDNITDVLLCMCVLGSTVTPAIKHKLEEKFLYFSSEIDFFDMNKVSEALYCMGYSESCPVVDVYLDNVDKHIQSLTNKHLHSIYFLTTLRNVKNRLLWKVRSRLFKLLNDAVTAQEVKMCLHYLSLFPYCLEMVDVYRHADRLMHQFGLGCADTVFASLQRIKMKAESNCQKMPENFLQTLQLCQEKVYQNIRTSESFMRIARYLDTTLSENSNLLLIDAAVKRLEDLRCNIIKACDLCKLLASRQYYSPVLMQAISDDIMAKPQFYTASGIIGILCTFGLFTFVPTNSADFFPFCMSRIIPVMHELKPTDLTMLSLALATNQVFPEKLLGYVFSLEFLSKLDQFLLSSNFPVEKPKEQLMWLNRSVALECPHLGIPWFHDDFCQKQMKHTKCFTPRRILDIQAALVGALGGSQYIRTFALMPYYYYCTFECVISAQGEPLPVANYGHHLNSVSGTLFADMMEWSSQQKPIPPGAQRVAIFYQPNSFYCSNVNRLLGSVTTRLRHAELMDYKVVTIPFYEWDVVESQPQDMKEDYLFGKIFSESEPTPNHSCGTQGTEDVVSRSNKLLRSSQYLQEDSLAYRILQRIL